jgi:arabinogalactan endo-1,4-beta-galactosidase
LFAKPEEYFTLQCNRLHHYMIVKPYTFATACHSLRVIHRYRLYLFFTLLIYSILGCHKSASPPITVILPPTVSLHSNFAKGADISWLTQMEAGNIKFYDSTGAQTDCLEILKALGMNAVRLRAWVNPADGWCNIQDLVNKALRAKNLGMNILIDFHYSDVWADPGHQAKPASWVSLNSNQLDSAIYNYTFHVMDTLKSNGIQPQWAQVGNETNDGFLWEDGRASTNMANFAALVTQGYNAIKAASDSTKVIVHVSNGFDNSLFRWMFDGLSANNAKWDIIGMSLYPSTTNWQTLDQQCLANMNDMVARYNKPVMICEVGMDVTAPAASLSFLNDIISKTNAVSNNMGLGVFYWEPESYNNWQGYTLGAFDNSGKPTAALNAFTIK